MEIAFRKNAPGLFPKLIRWWTSSPYSHCEVIFSNGFTFSADIEEFKTRFKSVSHNPDEWDIIKIPIERIIEYKVYDFCLNEENCLYDIIGIFFSQIIPISFENPWWWFCSENAVACLHKTGELLDIIPHQTSPGRLYKLLKERFPE